MAYWLLAIILSYLLFGLASLCDKIVLVGKPKPTSYTFYVGIFSAFVILLIPFTKFGVPDSAGLFWIILDAVVHIAGLYAMFVALEKFDVSRVITTIGATQPIFIFILTGIFWGPQTMPVVDILAFIILLAGSVIISIKKDQKVTGDYLKITLLSSFMFSLDYIFSKFVFLEMPFLQGIIWIRIFVFIFVLIFLIKKTARAEIFSKQIVLNKKTQAIFLLAQVFGSAANFLQSFAISLAPVIFLSTANSLRGIQYALLFLITIFVSIFFPKILKEELSKKIILQKIISIVLIAVGLGILVF